MNDSKYRVSLDIHDTGSQTMLNVKKNDTARKIYFSFTDGGRPYKIAEGCTAKFRAKKPDGTILFNNCTINENVIEYALTQQTSATVGIVECEVTLYGADSHQITSPRFTLIVEDILASDSEIESTNEFTALTEAVSEVNNLDISASKDETVATLTVTKKDGTTQSVTVSDGAKGEKGDKGDKGNTGVYVGSGDMPEDCNVQLDPNGAVFQVEDVYSPTSSNPQSGKAVKEAVAPKLDKPEIAPAVGKILKVKSVNEDGTFTCEWADAPSGGIEDVQIPYRDDVFPPTSPEYSEISILDDNGIAHIPRLGAKNNGVGKYGLIAVSVGQQTGFRFETESRWNTSSPGCISLYCASESIINDRYGAYNWGTILIPVNKLDYAVKSTLCDGKGTVWTDVERLAALLRMGCTVDDNGFVKWTAQEVSE